MKMHKKRLGVVLFSVLLIAIMSVYSIGKVKAVDVKPECKKGNETALKDWYGISPDIDSTKGTMTLRCKNGEFKITKISDPRGNIVNKLTTDSSGNVLIDGKTISIGGSKKTTAVFKIKGTTNPDLDPLRIYFELTNGGGNGCISYKDFLAKKDKDSNVFTYQPGPLEIAIPNLNANKTQHTVANSNYNGVCKAIRGNGNYKNKIDKTIMKMYDSSSEARSYYQTIVGSCWEQNTVVDYSESAMVSMIETALSTWYYQKLEDETINEVDSVWSLKFDDTYRKVPSKHKFFVEGNKFYKLTNSGKKGTLVSKNNKKLFTQQCNYKAKNNNDFSNLDLYKKGPDGKYLKDSNGKKVYNIDANVDYYYGKSETIGTVTYKWKYTSKQVKTETIDVCKRTCEEVVEVKYGPPIASKAGLCFEYQIQVTSRVRCKSDKLRNEPKQPKICNPTPWCNNIPGYVHQGGSNLEFDNCINACDGGKYTEKCSNKCYNQVYEKSNSTNQMKSQFDNNFTVEKISDFNWSPGCKGKYKYKNGRITWGKDANGNKTYGRYYCEEEPNRTKADHGAYTYSGGFKKHINANGLCKDPCSWSGCGAQSYMNRDEIARDHSANLKRYGKALAKCKAAATCTTKTANFRISVDYIDNKTDKTETIDFPAASGNDLQSSDDGSTCTTNPDINSDKNILLNYGGCYQSCGNSSQYHTRWSFPGTWINSKTGEIVYENPGNGESWKKQENKFCIPLNAKNVNPNWWNYYYHHINTTAGIETSVDSKEFKDVCLKNSNKANVTNTTSPSNDIIWNIHGSTTNFGYFGWKFKFECFYALNSNPASLPEDSSTTKEVKEKCINDTPETDYRIRSVDLTNLFPSTDGSKTAQNTVGRAPGYNWTKYANNAKNTNYTSLPLAYINDVQKLGYDVYNDSTLDYEFNLTPALMKKMRDDKVKYGEFKNGKSTQVKTGIVAYQSNLWRGSGVLAGNSSKVAQPVVVGCNNIDNYKSSTCKGN